MDQSAATGGTFHLVVSEPPTQQAVLQMITSRLGVAGLRLIDARCEPLVHPSPLERKVNRISRPTTSTSSRMSVSMTPRRGWY